MSVIKKLTCICGNVREVSTQVKPKDMTPCLKCGSKERAYDAKWTVRLELLDEQGRKYRYSKAWSVLKAEAVAHEAELKAAKSKGDRRGKDKPFVFEDAAVFFETWVASKLVEKTIADGTAKMYLSRLDCWLRPYFKGMDIRNLTETDIELYRTARLKGRVSPSGPNPRLKAFPRPATVNREVSTLKRITSLLYKRRLIPSDPLHGIGELPEDNERDQVLTVGQIESMYAESGRMAPYCRRKAERNVYPKHLLLAVTIGLNTGLRIDGVLTLRWSEINWDTLEIVKIVKGRRVKGGKQVRIPMNQKLTSALLAWRDSQLVLHEYVITSPRLVGRPIRVSSDFGFKSMCKAIGLNDFTFHQLRHQFATYFISRTKDIHLCSMILGHSTTYMTERYGHLVREAAKMAMNTFEL